MNPYTVNLADVGMADIATVGGKNASSGELLRNLASQGIRVPPGFAITAKAIVTSSRAIISSNR